MGTGSGKAGKKRTMIDVARMDFWAANGSGILHRASVPAKLFFLLLVVSSAVAADRPAPLAAGYGLLLLLAAAAGLPWRRMILLSFYAALFAVLYGLSQRAASWQLLTLLLKAVTPAYAVLILIVSTPYPRIFAFLDPLLPEILSAGLFMTYRTFFILLDMMGRFVVAIRLRGGFSPGSLVNNWSNIARGIAMLLVRAVERSSRLYAVMAVRGYSGSMAGLVSERPVMHDLAPCISGIIVLSLVIWWR